LNGRTQQVKLGDSVSLPINVTSGVPQGGHLSPILFTPGIPNRRAAAHKCAAKLFGCAV